MFLMPLITSIYNAIKGLGASKSRTPPLPTRTHTRILESEEILRKRMANTGRRTTIFTGGLFDDPIGKKARLIPS